MSSCVACGRTEARRLYEVRGFTVVKCECGLARTELPPDFDPASIYTQAYYQGGHVDGYADYGGSADELRLEFRRVVAELRRHVPGGNLIELGCAYGYFLDEAREAFDVCGVEVSDHARAQCIERGLDVVRELTPEVLASRGPFDAVVMLDVLEHMQRPDEVLGQLREAMRPGAQLMITTGDYGSLLSRATGQRWRLMTPPQHLWFFTRATLTKLLRRYGFEIHKFSHPWKRVPLNLVAYQVTRYLGTQSLLRKVSIPGAVPLNLFDAMRVIAVRN